MKDTKVMLNSEIIAKAELYACYHFPELGESLVSVSGLNVYFLHRTNQHARTLRYIYPLFFSDTQLSATASLIFSVCH